MKFNTTTNNGPSVRDEDGAEVVRLVSGGCSVDHTSGEWVTLTAGHTDDTGERGQSVTFTDLSAGVFAFVRHHDSRDPLLIETHTESRVYPAGRWPVLTITRGPLFDR